MTDTADPMGTVAGEGSALSAAVKVQSTASGTLTTIDSSAGTPNDKSTDDNTVSAAQWERLSGQRDVLIKAMVGVFTWLNGGVYLLTTAAWLVGIWFPDYRIVDANTLMTLIGATVVQAGIAFIAITRFLFPNPKAEEAP